MNPETTLKLMNEGFWGARAMERRVFQCCDANPGCPVYLECARRYDKYVDQHDPPNRKEWPSYRQQIVKRLEHYHRLRAHGVSGYVAARNTTTGRTELLLADTFTP